LKIYLKKNRGATIAAKEPKCSRGGGGTQQRGRRRDDTAAGGWRQRRKSRKERETAAAGVDFSPEVAERERDVLAWFSRRGGSGGGAKWRRSSARWWPARNAERNREKLQSCAREEERGC